MTKAGATGLDLGYPLPPGNLTESHAGRLIPRDNGAARQQLVQAGQQFEAYFISYLLKVMRETVPQGAIANKQGAYFHSFYDQEIGIRAAESGGIGITRMVQEYADKYFSPPPVQPSSSTR
jgi:flagellar protein FlgJ